MVQLLKRQTRRLPLGDAAHVHSPAGGQGMNTGMQDAFNLGWKLAMVVRKTCPERLLESYSPERSAVGDEVLKSAARLTTIGTLRNHLIQDIRNLVGHIALGFSPVKQAFADTMSETSIGYPATPLNGPALHAHPKPGERVVPVPGEPPAGFGTTPRFALFAAQTPAATQLVARHPALVDESIRTPPGEEGLWLVRPDGYVACSASDPAMIDQYLGRLTLAGS